MHPAYDARDGLGIVESGQTVNAVKIVTLVVETDNTLGFTDYTFGNRMKTM